MLLLILLQGDPAIENVERLCGDARRSSGLWSPLAVTLSSAAGFEGDLSARSAFGFVTARRVKLAAGGRERFLLPALEPEEVVAGGSIRPLPPARRAGLVVAVDERLPFASELVSDDRVQFVRVRAEDLDRLLESGMAEAFDRILRPPVTRADADRIVASLSARLRLELVDEKMPKLAPAGGGSKKDLAVFFVTVYAFAGFVAIVASARRSGRGAAVSSAAVAAAGVLAFVLLFPRGQVWMSGAAATFVDRDGAAEEWQIWFAGTGAERKTRLEFPRLVKPVLGIPSEVKEPFTIRAGDRGCEVEIRLVPGRAYAFGWAAPAEAAFPAPLRRASVRADGKTRFLGDLAAGQAFPRTVETPSPPPPEPELEYFGRRIEGDAVFGWVESSDVLTAELRSPDLGLPARRRPRFFMQGW